MVLKSKICATFTTLIIFKKNMILMCTIMKVLSLIIIREYICESKKRNHEYEQFKSEIFQVLTTC